MQKQEQGYALIFGLLGLVLITLGIETCLKDLEALASMVSLWQRKQLQEKEVSSFNLNHIGMGRFDYDWQYLGEYPCVQLCQPQCHGTRHWLLTINYGHSSLHLRILKSARHLKCMLPQPLMLLKTMVWRRKI